MKRTTQFILLLTMMSISLLSACGTGSSTTPPNADGIVKFDGNGVAVLRGHVPSGGSSPAANGKINGSLEIAVPAKVEGIETSLLVPFKLRSETILSSTSTKQMDASDYLIFNPNSSAYAAFPANALVEVTFRKNESTFVAISIHEVKQGFSLFPKKTVIRNVFSTDSFSQGMVTGRITQAVSRTDGSVIWAFTTPVQVQGIEAAVLLPFNSADDTEIVTPDGPVLFTPDLHFSWDHVQIQFTQRGQKLTAHQITVLP